MLKAVAKFWLVELLPSPANAVVSETLASAAPADASRTFQAGTLIVVVTPGGRTVIAAAALSPADPTA